jgi:hypothetical protein
MRAQWVGESGSGAKEPAWVRLERDANVAVIADVVACSATASAGLGAGKSATRLPRARTGQGHGSGGRRRSLRVARHVLWRPVSDELVAANYDCQPG